jgi:tetratricopeptide (TPR) repeat protein
MYAVVVKANTGASSVQEGIAGIGFSLLEENEAQEVRDAARQLAEQELSDEAKALALAHLYRRHNLMAEAIETLEALVEQGNSTAASYQLLGDCYREVRLNLHAIDAYLKAVELAVTPEDIELKAEAQTALGEVYINLNEFEQAVSMLKEARMAYIVLEGENSDQVIEIDSKLASLKLSSQ